MSVFYNILKYYVDNNEEYYKTLVKFLERLVLLQNQTMYINTET